MGKFFTLLIKNVVLQIKEKTFYFLLINLALSVGLFCTLFFMEFMLQTSTDESVSPKHLNIESAAVYFICMIIVLSYTMVNIVALYRYLNNENRKKFIVYKMYGCNPQTLFFLSFFEFFLYTIISSIAGTVAFYLTSNWRSDIGLVQHYQAYFGIVIYYFINIIVISCICYRVSKIKIAEKERL